jgi:hypothetical protein
MVRPIRSGSGRRPSLARRCAVNRAQWREVCEHLTVRQTSALEALLKVDSQTQESPFANLCRAPGRVSRKNLEVLDVQMKIRLQP